MNSHTITMMALDGMGFRKRHNNTMVCNFGEYNVIVYFSKNMLSKVEVATGMYYIHLLHVKTIDDIKLSYRVLTGKDWKG